MRITQLTPGTGHFYCGNCLRDVTLARALRDQGHDVTVMPLYLPVFSETDPGTAPPRVFLGGINVYLQHRLPWLGHLPGAVRKLLDAPGLLRWSSRQGDMTDAARHADMTLTVLRGDDGLSARELDPLLAWMAEHDRPDAVFLCNALLTGLARPIRQALGVPVITTLHGEDGFLDALGDPASAQAWAILRERAADVDAFIAVSAFYADQMRTRLDLPADRVHVVHNGIALDDITPREMTFATDGPRTIGYLARMCADKGLHTLVDAFIHLRERHPDADLRLDVTGVQLKPDRAYVRELSARLQAAGCLDRVTFRPNVTREEKLAFLRTLDVLSVPATCGEAFGLYAIEAMAHGVPVVQPEHGAFPELIARSGGGVLCAPDDASALADELARVLFDPDLSRGLAEAGRRSVLEYFNAERMARDVMAVCESLVSSSGSAASTSSPVTPAAPGIAT